MNLPIIAGVEITTDSKGRFSLNALHKASGAEKKHGPSYWLALDSTAALVAECDKQTTGISVVSLEGRNGGTFAHKLLAISYAGWISPAFQLQVNQVFLDYKTGQLQPIKPQSNILATDALLEIPSYMENIKRLYPNLGEASVQEIVSNAINMDVDYPLLPKPKIKEKFYTATELAEEHGVSANKIGRLANAYGLKTSEYGENRLSKSNNGAKQVEQFYYNERGRAALAEALEVKA
jgi:hypothetical protein